VVLKGLATYFKLYNIESSTTTKLTGPGKKITISAKAPGSGRLEKSVSLQITKFSDIVNIIIPFFNKYPIVGMKSLDFKDFKRICDIIKTKDHLTSSSVFNQILKIKSGMNQNRKWPLP
jgi:hypothetical protein